MSVVRARLGFCATCGKVVLQGDRIHWEVLGWEAERRQGGTNALRLRQRTGAVAHTECIDKAVRGLSGQLSLPVPSARSDTMSGHPDGKEHE
jgi:hypothetical protein